MSGVVSNAGTGVVVTPGGGTTPSVTGSAPGTGVGTGTPVANWYDGKASPEDLGLWQNKGWTATDPVAVALAATKAYQEAQKFVGVPHDELLRLPKNPVAPEWQGVWDRLGVPKDAAAYDLKDVKFADGEPLDANAEAFIRGAAIKAHITAGAMPEFAHDLVKFMDGQEASDAAETAAHLAAERAALQQNWGTNFEVNKFVAAQGAKALGLGDDVLSALESTAGYAKTMEALRRVGTLNKEDNFVQGGFPGAAGIMTKEQAGARMVELKRDPVWVGKLMTGDASAVREFNSLSVVMAGSNQ